MAECEKKMSLKDLLNSCKPSRYPRIAELRANCRYSVISFKEIDSKFGKVMTVLLENPSESSLLRLYLPKRYGQSILDEMFDEYNSGILPSMNLTYSIENNEINFKYNSRT